MSPAASSTIDRRTFLSAAGAALLPAARAQSTSDLKPVFSEVEKRTTSSLCDGSSRQPAMRTPLVR